LKKTRFIAHILFVQNAEILKLKKRLLSVFGVLFIANLAFGHIAQSKMLKLTFCQLPNIAIKKLTILFFYDII